MIVRFPDFPEVHMWGLLRLNPQVQYKYLGLVAEAWPDIQIYYPRYRRVTRPKGHRDAVYVLSAVYPGYLFVRLDCDLRMLLDTPVKVYFVRFGMGRNGRGGHIGVVRQEVIDRLRRMEAQDQLVMEVQKEDPYVAGRIVRVHTPVADIKGVIMMCTQSHKRVIVDTAMGPWDVPIHQVALV